MAETKDPRNTLRRVEFPEAGDGVYLHLRNSGIKILFAKHGQDYFRAIEVGLALMDISMMEEILDLALRDKKGEPLSIPFDELDFPLEKLQSKLLDCFTMASNGRTYEEQIEFLKDEARSKAAGIEDPSPPGPEATSEISSEEPTGPDSIPPSSTT